MTYSDFISSLGVTGILIAFFLSTLNIIGAKSKIYFLLNLIGGGFACYGSILMESIPFTILEIFWTIVAIIGLVKPQQITS